MRRWPIRPTAWHPDQSFTLTPNNLAAGSFATVASGPSSLADGTYSVVLSYSNDDAEPTASSTPLTWTLDTTTQVPQAPTVSGGADGAVRLWRLGEKPVAAPVERRDAPVSAVAAGSLSGGPAVAAAWVDGLVVIWDLESGRPDALRLGCLVRSVAFGPDDTLVVGGQHGVATIRFRPAVAWPDLRQANPDQANPDRTDDPVRADVNRTDPGRADVDRTDPGRAEGADFERAE